MTYEPDEGITTILYDTVYDTVPSFTQLCEYGDYIHLSVKEYVVNFVKWSIRIRRTWRFETEEYVFI